MGINSTTIKDDSVQSVGVTPQGIYLTPAAEQRVLSYLKEHHHHCLRLSVKKTGCSGLSYVIDYSSAPDTEDIVFSLNSEYALCVEKASYPYLKGLQMDYVKQGLGSKFVFQNPNQTGQCGCGESFTTKD
ncbi:MAG TPA: iron-sulfur cluster assembly accessory protein [Legionellaceae bacterium]|nr:iron-sulfur cluster assembly accessory protein [Legionellaceae bacterium]